MFFNPKDTPEKIARALAGYVEDACGEVAYEQAENPMTPEWSKRVNGLAAKGVQDVPGRLADDLYNEAGLIYDLLGDQIHGIENREAVLDALEKVRSHTGWKEAIKKLRE